MTRNEIYKELQMSYDELQLYLINKYGSAPSDYFATPECKSKSKRISRTNEGLYCHHMDEDKGANLSDSGCAKTQPWEWQKKERLVYCNIIEHFILHMKIAVLRQNGLLKKTEDVRTFFTTGGLFQICNDINEMFVSNENMLAWKKRCYWEIRENYEDYILLIKSLLAYIDENYCGRKNTSAFLKPGSMVHFSDCNCEILKVSKKKDKFLLKLPTGEEKVFLSAIASKQFKYSDHIDIATRRMASKHDEFCESIYNDIIACNKSDEVSNYVNALKIDYTGYGYTQYADIKLTAEFGAKNADEYISKAFPMYCKTSVNIEGKKPKFWKGNIPSCTQDLFYIIRIETMFTVKAGVTPFVRYKKRDLLRNSHLFEISKTNNLRDYEGTILATSDIRDSRTNKYYSQHMDFGGNIVDATVVLTLGKDDFLLFKELHDIRYLKVLDGCYFE